MLLKHGADPFAKSRNGDDALQIACLKGAHQIFDLLKCRIQYSSERLADAHELIGMNMLSFTKFYEFTNRIYFSFRFNIFRRTQ